MHYLKDQAFVIKRINFGDSDRYLTLFSQNHGKMEVVARGVRKITSKRAGNVELLNRINFQAVKGIRNHVLTEVALIDSYEELKRELSQIKEVFLMCELIDAVMPAGVVHSDIFDLMDRALKHVSTDTRTMTYFQAKLLSSLGFWDGKISFKNDLHVRNFMEQVIERKLRSDRVFDSSRLT